MATTTSSLLFIQVPPNGKILDKKDRHAIQRHAMRDTAAERRRVHRMKRPLVEEKLEGNESFVELRWNGTIQSDVKRKKKEKLGRSMENEDDGSGEKNRVSDEEVAQVSKSRRRQGSESREKSTEMQMEARRRVEGGYQKLESPRKGIGLGAWRMNPFDSWPVEMNLENLFLVDYVYTSPHPNLIPFRDTWLPFSSSDPALFYEVLSHISRDLATLSSPSYPDSISTRGADLLVVRGERNVENVDRKIKALKYHALAIKSVNERLLDPVEGISDGVIGTVLAFACFSHSRKEPETYMTHMNGLLAIIKKRGGVHKIDHNRILRLLLAGLDVTTSCFLGHRPTFTHALSSPSPAHSSLPSCCPYSPSILAPVTSPNAHQEFPWSLPLDSLKSHWRNGFPRNAELGVIFGDLSTIIMTIKSECEKRLVWQDETFCENWVEPLVENLVAAEVEISDLSVDGGKKEQEISEKVIEEGCRLGALVLLSKIRRRFYSSSLSNGPHIITRNNRLVFTGYETDRLKLILQHHATKWYRMKPLMLWTAVQGAIEVGEGEDEVFCDVIREGAEELGLTSWGELVITISPFLWIGEVLDRECEDLGRRVSLLGENPIEVSNDS